MDINSKDYVEMTPVMLAAYRGNREVFDILVNKGADLSIVDEDGDNILHWACRGGNVEMVNHILIQNLVDINSKGDAGMTPVLIAAYLAKREVFNCLVKHGADLSVVGEDGDNILHSACCGGNVEIVNDILAKNFVNINTKGYKGRSPMLHSVYHRKREVFDFLVKQGADLSVVDEDGDNILHLACGRGNMKMVKYILTQTTVDINSRNNKKMTPLLVAAYHGKRDVLALLIATGAHVLAVDHKGRNMLHIPCTRGDVDTVKYVLNLNSVDINSKDLKGMTPVLNAAYWGESELFDIFSKRGADLSVTDKDGNNILHIACMGDTELVKHVVKLHVVDINCRGCNGMTPLLYCAQYCERDVFELLLESGADPLVVNTDGDNVLHLACEKGSEDIVESLLSQNIVNLTTKNKEGLNASEIARGNGFLSLAKLLSQAYQSLR